MSEDAIEARCSKDCQYLFHECEADGTLKSECRTYFNDCVEECAVVWPEGHTAVSGKAK